VGLSVGQLGNKISLLLGYCRGKDYCMYLSLCIRKREIIRAKSVLSACVMFFLVAKIGYGMQPPPPPLDIMQLKRLISEADVIVVGKIDRVKESKSVNGGQTKKSIEVILSVKKLLKGEVSGKAVFIKESYPVFAPLTPGSVPRTEGVPKKAIIGLRAGPSCYYGRYKQGDRIIVLLANIEGTGGYKPLGSGTYDKHLCEFPIENDVIKTFYFRFATDLVQYVGSEEKFIDLIKSLIHSDSGRVT